MDNFFELIFFCVLVVAGYFVGSRVEKNHYRSIRKRESQTLNLPIVTAKNFLEEGRAIESTQFVYGTVVISTDFFKLVFSGLRNLFGGNISAYETLLDRARREALLRLKAMAQGADLILNLRLETSSITQVGTIEVFAYGTAIYYKKT